MNRMKTGWAFVVSMIAACAIASPAIADDEFEIEFETSIMKDKDEVPLDPNKAYILLQTPTAIPATFFRVPSDAERELSQQARAVALAEAKEDYLKDLARYQKRVESSKKRGKKVRGSKPIEPTETSFGWPPVEQSLMFSIGPFNRFAKSKGSSLYLQEVPPGEYVYYGTTSAGLGACACMGTVKFQAEAGQITMLRYDGVWLDKNGDPISRGRKPEGVDTNDALVRVAMIIEPADMNARDARLPQDWLVDAQLVPVEFVPNWFGAEINRLAPIPGVLAYQRDQVIDVQAELAAEREAARAAEAAQDAQTASTLQSAQSSPGQPGAVDSPGEATAGGAETVIEASAGDSN
ncbi:MAG: hypothetical protein QNJ15_08910 [Erythrobacter sp.]|nr:hypothetical protein [Erythrobacter sp.]